MINFNDGDEYAEVISDFEIEEAEEIEEDSILEHYAEKALIYVLVALWWLVRLLFVSTFGRVLLYLFKGIRSTAERMWSRFTGALADAFGKVLGWVIALVIVAAFTMSFTANNYSLSKTFSWKGLVTLYKTFE